MSCGIFGYKHIRRSFSLLVLTKKSQGDWTPPRVMEKFWSWGLTVEESSGLCLCECEMVRTGKIHPLQKENWGHLPTQLDVRSIHTRMTFKKNTPKKFSLFSDVISSKFSLRKFCEIATFDFACYNLCISIREGGGHKVKKCVDTAMNWFVEFLIRNQKLLRA